MPRTRDFVLVLVILVFVVIGLGSSLISWLAPERPSEDPIRFSVETVDEYGVAATDSMRDRRAERIAALRAVISQQDDIFIFEGDIEQVPDADPAVVAVNDVLRCPTYVPFVEDWDAALYRFDIIEGARVLSRIDLTPVGTTTATATRQVVAALPLSPLISPTPNCINSDVVGFTPQGELIRNSDAALYQNLSENNFVGYALDGYPIYGPSSEPLDQCGGRQLAGLYRYQIPAAGTAVLSCFTAVPAPL